MGVRWAAVLRPCEIRAFVELVKLKQARTDELILISVDCLGAFQNKDFIRFAGADPPAATLEFLRRSLAGESFQRNWPRPAGRASSRCPPRPMFTSGFSGPARVAFDG